MNYTNKDVGLGRTIFAAALLAAFAPAHADDSDDFARLTQLTSDVSVGAAAASGDERDRTIFGEYNGLRKHDTNLLLDFDITKRNDQTGTWTIIRGRDLGLDTPELDFTVNRQGDWKISGSYEEIVKHDIRTVNTGMLGVGTTTPTISVLAAPGSGQDENLELKRQRLGLNLDKWITPFLQVQATFKNEDKTGTVSWGRGFACGGLFPPGPGRTWNGTACSATAGNQWALLWLPQPVDSRTDQIEAKLNYHTEKLFLSGGYYGSFYRDNVGNLTPTVAPGPYYLYNRGTTTNLDPGLANVLSLPMALWPDNQAHQVYVDGTYAFTQILRSTFNVSYTRATQDDSFSSMGLAGAPAGVSSLDAVVDTTRAQFGLTWRPITKLSLVGDLRYENRDDKTPIQYYNQEPPSETWTNSPISNREVFGKLEGTYQLPAHLLGTLGIDYKSIHRDLPLATDNPGGLTALREKTEETGYRAELRRTFSDKFTGSIGLIHAKRTGSNWYAVNTKQTVSDSQLAAANPNGGALPVYLLDRKRDKVRLMGEWAPTDRASLQLVVEDGRDRFDAPMYTGMQSSDSTLYSLDASYAISYRWKLTGYISRTDQTIHVNQPSNASYQMGLRDLEDAIGVGLVGKPIHRLDVGAKLSFINDRYSYSQSMGPTASAANLAFLAASGGLPDVVFRHIRLDLFGNYTLDKSSAVRVDLIHENDHLDEWTWGNAGVPFNYADNTTISLNPNQRVTVLMGRYIYKFH